MVFPVRVSSPATAAAVVVTAFSHFSGGGGSVFLLLWQPYSGGFSFTQPNVRRQVFSAWTEFDDPDMISECNRSFSNLEDAFKEGGVLHEKQVYLFMCPEISLLYFNGQAGVSCIPAVVAVGIISGLRDSVEIIDMEQLNLDWVPYIPPGEGGVVEGHESHIFMLSCVERRDDLEQRLRHFLPCK